MTKTLAIIPARGGSKSIPRKNVLPIGGMPLLGHTIVEALRSQRVERVVVSTDDPEIGVVAQAYGAEVIWRPTEISGDFASSEAALLHVLETLAQNEGYHPDVVAFLQCTSPLTLAEDIDGTIDTMFRENAETALAVADFHYFLWEKREDGSAHGINHDKITRKMRQQREPQFLETGAVYVMRVPGFLQAKHRFFGTTAMHVIPLERRLEIDEPVDFAIAEVLLRHRSQSKKLERLPEKPAALVMDFDGVLTDNRVYVAQDGTETVACSRGDGMGLTQLRDRGFPLLVISKERNPVIAARCEKLDIPCFHGIDAKLPVLRRWAKENRIDLQDVVYVGNDVNDVECLAAVGCGVVVADAHPAAICTAQFVLTANGGHGAVRELTDLIEQRLKGCHSMSETPTIKVYKGIDVRPRTVAVGDRAVGPGNPVYVIGEIGLNHNGDIAIAKRLIDAAADAGCDAVKFQKRTPEVCVPPEQRNLPRETPWGKMTYLEYRYRVEFDYAQYAEIDAYCKSKGIAWFASCWDEQSIDFIEQFKPACYKLASASITDGGLMAKHAATGRPIMLSTGMSTMEQIRKAASYFEEERLLVAHATSTYPCPPEELNLRMVDTLLREFNCPIGYSGHETGLETTCAAVALGATFVERHITLDRTMWGSDQAASVEPGPLKQLVQHIRIIERALGDGVKRVYDSELGPMKKLRRVA